MPTSDQTFFLNEWQTYRKILDQNYMFHREVYGVLCDSLLGAAPTSGHFLDIACGDAAATAIALRGVGISHYYGIDISLAALEVAQKELGELGFPFTLYHQDFAEALVDWQIPVDFVWIGQSLHHLDSDAKLELMRQIRRVLGPSGLFMIWEPTTLPGETRDQWVTRFETGSRHLWFSLSDEEWNAVVSHTRAADLPETAAHWLALGREAGFVQARELYKAPTELARVYQFSD